MSKVLIVEDEEAIADIEKDYLELSWIHGNNMQGWNNRSCRGT